MNDIEMSVNCKTFINLSINDNASLSPQEVKTLLSLYLKLDCENRQKIIPLVQGMLLGQETNKGNSIDIEI